eukprot:Plantae.Rhodophyta-Purpureofilum_apyrenoidigerum.ctg14223.p2 GENE.Plantae.Rhodophyta-Purpureofilum_apyrenoidigerum.ctg14223~~Plantae.Rhodophyta-Purpureofilum_apyrenoidigerum.ctg14223.p2  ORF type:complete len:435 (+),score=70.23 Plantae.Rhodophyta-Purpureofilum_apyrenoidigerum.ctg14223:159-1463(+)
MASVLGKLRVITLFVLAWTVLIAYWIRAGAQLALDRDLRDKVFTHFQGSAGSCEGNPLGAGGRVALEQFPYKCGWNYVSSSEDGGLEVFAHTMPSGKLGWSNTALVVDHNSKQSVLFDVTMDASTTSTMLRGITNLTETAPMRSVIFTHGDPDHVFGACELPPDAELFATKATIDEINEANSTNLHATMNKLAFAGALTFGMFESVKRIPRIGTSILYPQLIRLADLIPAYGTSLIRLLRFGFHYFMAFKMHSVRYIRIPDSVLVDEANFLDGKVQLDFFSGHSKSDVIGIISDAGVAVAGDILFMGIYPLAKFGPAANLLRAIDSMLANQDIKYFIPGHGPIMDRNGVQQIRQLFKELQDHALECKSKQLSRQECIERFQTAADSKFGFDAPEHLEISLKVELDRLEGKTPDKDYFLDVHGESLVQWGIRDFQ